RIGLAALGLPVAVAVTLGVAEERVVLGVLEHDAQRQRFQRRERRLRLVLCPQVEEEIARLVARGIKHRAGPWAAWPSACPPLPQRRAAPSRSSGAPGTRTARRWDISSRAAFARRTY